MDWGRARYRQAHRLPPHDWEVVLMLIAIVTVIVVVVWPR